jgi:hypothetical protein
MVDPIGGSPNRSISSQARAFRVVESALVLAGLGGYLAVCLVLIGGLVAAPWIAGGLFFYNAVRATPAAQLYQQAPACATDGPTRNCVLMVHGTVTAMDERISHKSLVTDFSVELPSGAASGRMTTFLVAPPSWLVTGQAVDVTLYQGKITNVSYNGARADTDDNPVVYQHELLISGSMCLVFGLVLEGGIFIAIRRIKRPGSPPTPTRRR